MMLESGAYGERMARYLHLPVPPLYCKIGSARFQLAVTRLHAPTGFTEPTSHVPKEKAFSIHLHLRATSGGRLWLDGKLVPTPKRPSGGVTILDLEQDPVAFFPNPIDVMQFYIPRASLEDFCYQNKLPFIDNLQWPYCGMDRVLTWALLFYLVCKGTNLHRSYSSTTSAWQCSRMLRTYTGARRRRR